MLIDNMGMIFTIIAAIVGVISVSFMWVYAIESACNVKVGEFSVYKPYINVTYLFYLLVPSVLWLTSKDFDIKVVWMFLVASFVWLATAIVVLIISFVHKPPHGFKKELGSVVISAVCKAMIAALLLWLVS